MAQTPAKTKMAGKMADKKAAEAKGKMAGKGPLAKSFEKKAK